MSIFKITPQRIFILMALTGFSFLANAHEGPLPVSLKNIPVPEVPGLVDGVDPIVIDKQKAIALGKALFWDTGIGSDGMACASCHFHAGADRRTKNQLSPSGKSQSLAAASFDVRGSGNSSGSNYQLVRTDFPFTQSNDPLTEISAAGFLRISNDVAGSAGTFGGLFKSVELSEQANDSCIRAADSVFHVNSSGTRRVTPRNAPSVFNAAFNHRNFWDGRANNIFNGSSQWGERDSQAGVWIKNANNTVSKQKLQLINSSLASVAIAPPLDTTEMSCEGRGFADIGRKLMWRRPLESQNVHWQDSVLGQYAFSSAGNLKPGLNTYYVTLVRQAFNKKYWSSTQRGPFGSPVKADENDVPLPYNQYEANFGMFFALSLQLYQSTLISDDSPFDRSARDESGIPVDLTESQIRGMIHFRDAHCNQCHLGPTFSAAAIQPIAKMYREDPDVFRDNTYPFSTTGNVAIRQATAKGSGIIDTGFAATGVTDDSWDIGVAGQDIFGNPLSFAPQYLQFLAGNTAAVVDPEVPAIRACDLGAPIALNIPIPNNLWFTQVDGVMPQPQSTANCFIPGRAFVPTPAAAAIELAKPNSKKMMLVNDSAFKIPSLRNVELTGPYMHNGSMATLEEVIEFYTRGGNFEGQSKNVAFIFPQTNLSSDPQAREDLLNFLKSLTDERVRMEKAPFDHPELKLVHGHSGNSQSITENNALDPALAADEYIYLPAVGANGLQNSLQPFDSYLE